MIFNDFVLTSRNYIRTVSEVKPEWYVYSFPASCGVTDRSRLLEIAPNYFDISSFPEGEMKRALRHVAKAEPNGNPDATGLVRSILKTLYVL